jgi:hypothetical protein
LIEEGQYYDDTGAFLQWLGAAGRDHAGHDFDSDLTNEQFVSLVFTSGNDPIGWHFLGSYFDDNGMPSGFRFTPFDWILDMCCADPPYSPMQLNFDMSVELCAHGETPLHQQFRKVRVPILYVGAAGGVGQFGEYSNSLTASSNITKLIIQLLPDDQRTMDYGHADLVAADNAETLVWLPILSWIQDHQCAVTISTNPTGRSFTVDGAVYSTTRTFYWASGSSHTIATGSPQTVGGACYIFSNWSDGGAISHTITTPVDSAVITANFTTQYLLTTSVSPSGSGTISADPASLDGFYPGGQGVTLTATPDSTVFTGWSGDLSGMANPQSIVMSAPHSVTASFGSCTYSISPSTRNHEAAGGTGSIGVTASEGCTWTASSDASWITITSGSSGSGSGTVAYLVSPNPAPSPRSGTITAAGYQFTVDQEAALVPVISSLQPSQAVAGGPGFTLIVTGSNFTAGAVVLWNGQPRPTTFVGTTELRAEIGAADIAVQGSAQVAVSTPGGATSVPAAFMILYTNPAPTIETLSPAACVADGPGFKLTVTGTGFVPDSKVQWDGQDRPTTFESSTILTALIPATDITAKGSIPVTVFNPPPGGGTSNAIIFEIMSGEIISDLP